MPESVRAAGERYWTAVEIPVTNEFVFLVNVRADEPKRLGPRTLLVVSFHKLLELFVDVGVEAILSISGLQSADGDSEPALEFIPLSEIAVAEHSGDGWRKVFAFRLRGAKGYTGKPCDADISSQLVNLVSIVTLPEKPSDLSPPNRPPT